MKIAMYIPSWPPGFMPNGIVTYAAQIVPALHRLGHEVYIVSQRTPEGFENPNVVALQEFGSSDTIWDRAAFRLLPRYAHYKTGAARLFAALKDLVGEHSIDVLETEETFGWSFEVSKRHLTPVVVRLHGPWLLNGRFEGNLTSENTRAVDLHRLRCEGRAIQQADFVSAPSADVLASVKRHYSARLPASRVIPNPLPASVEGETWRLDVCKPDSVLFVGRSDERKGGDLVLRAFARLAPSCPELRLTFVGPDRGIKAPDGTTCGVDGFVRNVIPEECRNRLQIRGQMEHSHIAAERRAHFATVIASRYETAGYTVLEAMSLGCPIVATAVGGIPELIQNEHNGLLVPPDSDAIAAALRRLLDNPDMAAQLGRQAWLDCQSLYSPDTIARQTIAAYEEAIASFRLRQEK